MRRQYITHPKYQYAFTMAFVFGVILIIGSIGVATIVTLNIIAGQSILTEFQQSYLRSGAKEMLQFVLIMGLPMILIFIFLGIYLSYKFVGPLARLESWCEFHLLGKEPKSIVLRPNDELEPISIALNRTVEKLVRKRNRS